MTVIHGQPDTSYHADPHIGSSTARLCLKSMRLFHDRITGIDKPEDKEHFKIGRLAHMMALEPERFRAQTVTIGPINPKTGSMYGRDTKAFAEWQAANPTVTIVEPWLYTMLDRMPGEIRALLADPDGVSECSVYQVINGVGVKCRPDRLNRHAGRCYDLKTIDDVDNIKRAVRSRTYWFAQEWYKRVLRAEYGTAPDFSFIFAEKKPPFRWRILTLNAEACEEGAAAVRGVLLAIRAGNDSGCWDDHGGINMEMTWDECGHYEGDNS